MFITAIASRNRADTSVPIVPPDLMDVIELQP